MGWRVGSILIATTVSCFAVALFTASQAIAYPTPVDFDGKILRWNVNPTSPPITFVVEGDDADIVEEFTPLVTESAELWSGVDTSYFRFAPAANGVVPQVRFKLQKSISGGEHSAGYSIMQKSENGHPAVCEIYVAVDEGTAYVPFAKTALHEFGHCVGLGHSLVPEAIMSYSLAKNSFALDIDDEAAVTRLYPVDSDAPKLPPGCAVGSATQGNRSSTFLLTILMLPLMIVFVLCVTKRDAPRNYGRASLEHRDDPGTSSRVA